MTTPASTDAAVPTVTPATDPPRVEVTVRYFAGAAEAARTATERVSAATAGQLRAAMVAAHGDELARVLDRCTLLADGVRLDSPGAPLAQGATVDVLPPFAGG